MHVGNMSATNTIALEDSTIVGGAHALEAATFASGDDIEATNTILHALAGSHAVTLSGQPGQPLPFHSLNSNLMPGTTYQFTLSAVSGPAFGQGTDLTFTTLSLPGGGSGPCGGGPGPGQGSGPRPAAKCVVPKLNGKTLAAAKKALRKAGCALGKVRKPKHGHGKLVVASQRVKPRTSVAAGTTVGVMLAHKRRAKQRRR
jgi:hypothetical protein